jgi:LysM repeat protein
VAATATATPCPNPYIVQRGDWMYKIARQCGVDPRALIAANPGLNPDRIFAGQRIILPEPTPTP